MKRNPLIQLADLDQSIWLDYIRRNMLVSGELERLIEKDGLRGMTSNPAIFAKAIGQSDDYDEAIRDLAGAGRTPVEIYERLAIEDVGRAADLFRPLYDRSDGRHGFVSIEVSPHLAHDTEGTVAEAHRLWKEVARPNVMVKVPGTREGLPAITRLIGDGVNVNVTLLFGLPRYREVVEAYMAGLETRLAEGHPVDRIASVASFFLSRIDVLVDPMLEKIVEADGPNADVARRLHGEVAIASAKQAYQIYRETTGTERFAALARQGARPQRVLWASTSTKNPEYSDVKYVEALIGSETVNTVPPETLDAYRDHGNPAPRLEEDVDQSQAALDKLSQAGIDLDKVTQQLEDEGVDKFARPFDKLIATIEKASAKARRLSRSAQ